MPVHPAMLDEFGLAVTLDAYLRMFSQRTDISTDFVHDGMDARISPDIEICVYRQRAVNPVRPLRHRRL
jgi:signal transduction histidine kinase